MRLNRQLSVLFNRNRSNFSYLTLILLYQSARHLHPPGQRDRTSCNATQRGGSQIRDPPGKKKETTLSLTSAPAPHRYIRSSSRSAFADAAAISFFDLCQDPGCEHPLCNDEGACIADGLAGSFCPEVQVPGQHDCARGIVGDLLHRCFDVVF